MPFGGGGAANPEKERKGLTMSSLQWFDLDRTAPEICSAAKTINWENTIFGARVKP
jgi:hypothetical protein